MKIFTAILFFTALGFSAVAQTQNDTIYNLKTLTPVVIDGQATEDCWQNAEWHNIDQVWIPYNAKMDEGDFEGKFKVSWDENYLYLLVEVVDDSLSDDHSDPLQNWWDDDCLEVFIDENRSMGDHERNCNAFAYHTSLFYDAVDLNSSGAGVNYKNNIEVDMDTIGDHRYLWEFAIKNYDATFNINNPEASRVYLSHNKLMGFTLAYCDNDETTARENFIGSMQMTAAHNNDMYKNADYFGPMLLLDPDSIKTNVETNFEQPEMNVYPIPAKNSLIIELSNLTHSSKSVSIANMAGQVVYQKTFIENKLMINTNCFDAGMYILQVNYGNNFFTRNIVKQ